MVTLPLGTQAYKRTFAGEPEVRCVNRFLEKNPTNLKEHVALLARAGEVSLGQFAGGRIRGLASFVGLFNSDLFIVSGTAPYRLAVSGGVSPITGTVADNGFVYFSWMKGIGYERLFVSDGLKLQYYNTHAMGVLTAAAGGAVITDIDSGGQKFAINGVYYAWSANVDSGSPAGTSGNPWRALLGTTSSGVTKDQDSLANMVLAINFTGLSGVDYSSALTGPNADATATSDAATLTATAIQDLTTGNLVTTTESGANLSWAAATLTGGGNQALQNIPMPNAGEVPGSLTELSGYVLVGVAGTQKFYWINPGEVTIDPLNFAEKESNPDNILSMVTVGDQAIICGAGSTESWYATGTLAAPFAPIDGRAYKRGILAGTEVAVKDSLCLIGNDGIVYGIGADFSDNGTFGVHRISTHGIEERIRVQMRLLQGLPA